MNANTDPQRAQFIRALLAAPHAVRRRMAAERREFWLGEVEAARRRVEDRQRKAAGLEGILDPSQQAMLALERATLRQARGRLEQATKAWAAMGGDETDGGEQA